VWERYTEAPRSYPGMVEVLRRSKPSGTLFSKDTEPYAFPQDNERAEADVRQTLAELAGRSDHEARPVIDKLEADHSIRRETVWAVLGEAPLATALRSLAVLAERTKKPLAGASLDDAIGMYAGDGWQTDSAVIDALAAVKSKPDHDAVSAAIKALYASWLDKSATAFQKLAADGYPVPDGEVLDGPGVLLFADGLRMDVGHRLAAQLQARKLTVRLTPRLAGIPTATITAKPAVAPIAGLLKGAPDAKEFELIIASSGKNYTTGSLKAQLAEAGYKHLAQNALPTGVEATTGKHWTEFGTLDARGHHEQARLAALVSAEIEQLAERVMALLDAGVREVKVVTDHGWLLLPGGLPKAEMPKYLVTTHWPRCASVKPDADVAFATFPWRFDEHVRVVSPPGCAIFKAGDEYSHGGISPQECVTPVLTVSRTGAGGGGRGVMITGVEFKGFMARVAVSGGDGVAMDIRLDGASTMSSLRDPDTSPLVVNGLAKIYLQDTKVGDHLGQLAEVVALDESGAVLARYKVTLPS